jgi:hyperosmotically inducible periplasmic protein
MNSAFRRTRTLLALTAFLAGSGASVRAQDPQPPPDNTKVNKGDRKKSEPTADQQDNNRSDLDITKRIRESVIKDKSLSTYAHNVKIITEGGMVTLKGPVRSDAEKRSIEEKAAAVVGPSKVTSELAVKPKQ